MVTSLKYSIIFAYAYETFLPIVDPLGPPTVPPVGIIVFTIVVRSSVHSFQNIAKQNKVKTMIATGKTVGLAEWIIDDTCLVTFNLEQVKVSKHMKHCKIAENSQ